MEYIYIYKWKYIYIYIFGIYIYIYIWNIYIYGSMINYWVPRCRNRKLTLLTVFPYVVFSALISNDVRVPGLYAARAIVTPYLFFPQNHCCLCVNLQIIYFSIFFCPSSPIPLRETWIHIKMSCRPTSMCILFGLGLYIQLYTEM